MKHIRVALLLIGAVSGLLACVARGQERSRADEVSIWQARRISVAALQYARIQEGRHYELINRDSVRITLDNFEFDASDSKHTYHYTLALASIGKISTDCNPYTNWHFNVYNCALTVEGTKKVLLRPDGEEKAQAVLLFWPSQGRDCRKDSDCLNAALSFAVALNRLQAFAEDDTSPLRMFPQQAAAWRVLPVKPPIPESVREQGLLAENAVKERKLEEALDHYEAGVELYPTWPQGWFNAALIASELGLYSQAAEHMQSYLELVPDAQDAKAARDQITIWKYKATNK
jgi:tetratricopeptide (TPR) repeat protein